MKENRLTIVINRPVDEVFDFTTNSQNTPTWVNDIIKEETNETPIRIGTIYRNKNRETKWTEYEVVALEKNKLFELHHTKGSYSVRYTYEPIGSGRTKLMYFEWDKKGLDSPFSQEVLKKLKKTLESRL